MKPLGTVQYPLFLIPCLKSATELHYRAYATAQKRKGASSKRLQGLKPRDEYAITQAEQRKTANLSRQAVLREERAKSMGDPIRGITTPFIESLDTPTKTSPDEEPTADNNNPVPHEANNGENFLNHYLTEDEVEGALQYSQSLTSPLEGQDRAIADTSAEHEARERHRARHETAKNAIDRIVSMNSTSSQERTRANVRRIIHTFGRHNTDTYLKPKAPSLNRLNSTVALEPTPRAGPDTGSSEVQIGILTAKIRILADRYEGENRNDKVNKRNLRLLLHRRQKLLKYMEKKERGSGRWHNMIEKLGLTEATWKGEIGVQ